MKALAHAGPAKSGLEVRPKPQIVPPRDAIVEIAKTTIHGADLHILECDVPTCSSLWRRRKTAR